MRNGLILVAASLLASSCSGGGGGPSNQQEPCCNAQGQTVPPGSAFGAAPVRYAQAFLANPAPAACPDLDAAILDFSGVILDLASEPVEVASDGTFTIELFDEVDGAPTAGQRLFVNVFDGSGDTAADRGVGVLSDLAVEGGTIPVAPIRFGANVVGESTIEMVLGCRFETASAPGDQLQNMTFDDVRAFVDDNVVLAFNASAGPDRLTPVRDIAKRYRHGINGMIAVLDSSGQPQTQIDTSIAELNRLRFDAERFVDRCRLGLEAEEGCLGIVGPLRADAYRYWYMARFHDDYGIAWGQDVPPTRTAEVFQAWADDVLLQILSDGPPTPGYEMGMFRQNQLLRLELVRRQLRIAYSCYGDSDGDSNGDGLCEGTTVDPFAEATGAVGGPPYLALEGSNGAIAVMRQEILTGNQDDINAAWGSFATNVVYNFGIQADGMLYGDGPSTYTQAVVQPATSAALAARFDMLDGCNQAPGSDWTNEDIRLRLFDAAGRCSGVVDGPRVVVDDAMFTNFGSTDPDNYYVVADAVFWATINVQ